MKRRSSGVSRFSSPNRRLADTSAGSRYSSPSRARSPWPVYWRAEPRNTPLSDWRVRRSKIAKISSMSTFEVVSSSPSRPPSGRSPPRRSAGGQPQLDVAAGGARQAELADLRVGAARDRRPLVVDLQRQLRHPVVGEPLAGHGAHLLSGDLHEAAAAPPGRRSRTGPSACSRRPRRRTSAARPGRRPRSARASASTRVTARPPRRRGDGAASTYAEIRHRGQDHEGERRSGSGPPRPRRRSGRRRSRGRRRRARTAACRPGSRPGSGGRESATRPPRAGRRAAPAAPAARGRRRPSRSGRARRRASPAAAR